MLKDIVEVRLAGAYRLYLRFADGVEGEVDIASLVRFHGVFAPLQEQGNFAAVRVDRELGTIVWANGADLDPDVLYAATTGRPVDVDQPAMANPTSSPSPPPSR
jgi:Protein of unknown function (DUF2442)